MWAGALEIEQACVQSARAAAAVLTAGVQRGTGSLERVFSSAQFQAGALEPGALAV